jgi:hypothetical protein
MNLLQNTLWDSFLVFFEQSKQDMFIIFTMRELASSQSSSHFPLVETNHQKERKEPHMPQTKNNT